VNGSHGDNNSDAKALSRCHLRNVVSVWTDLRQLVRSCQNDQRQKPLIPDVQRNFQAAEKAA
jgi:hypothetical protein